jgi:hypothetical protein
MSDYSKRGWKESTGRPFVALACTVPEETENAERIFH